MSSVLEGVPWVWTVHMNSLMVEMNGIVYIGGEVSVAVECGIGEGESFC